MQYAVAITPYTARRNHFYCSQRYAFSSNSFVYVYRFIWVDFVYTTHSYVNIKSNICNLSKLLSAYSMDNLEYRPKMTCLLHCIEIELWLSDWIMFTICVHIDPYRMDSLQLQYTAIICVVRMISVVMYLWKSSVIMKEILCIWYRMQFRWSASRLLIRMD